MGLKTEFMAALNSNTTHQSLLELVHHYQNQGLSADEAYRILEQIWLESGFDEREDTDSRRDNLEYVMEKVWYQGAH